jgi:hypothetical protein
VPRKIFVITIITKALEFAFIHFFLGQFLDLQWSGRRSDWFREGNKGGFFGLRRDNMLFLLSSFSYFQPTLGVSHEDMGTYLILEATDKSFSEKSIKHSLHVENPSAQKHL